MSDYDDTNKGALFKNDKKESDSHPDYKGKINVAGQEFWLSAWINTSAAGKKYMSVKVTPKEAQQGGGGSDIPDNAPGADLDCDIPF